MTVARVATATLIQSTKLFKTLPRKIRDLKKDAVLRSLSLNFRGGSGTKIREHMTFSTGVVS